MDLRCSACWTHACCPGQGRLHGAHPGHFRLMKGGQAPGNPQQRKGGGGRDARIAQGCSQAVPEALGGPHSCAQSHQPAWGLRQRAPFASAHVSGFLVLASKRAPGALYDSH